MAEVSPAGESIPFHTSRKRSPRLPVHRDLGDLLEHVANDPETLVGETSARTGAEAGGECLAARRGVRTTRVASDEAVTLTAFWPVT